MGWGPKLEVGFLLAAVTFTAVDLVTRVLAVTAYRQPALQSSPSLVYLVHPTWDLPQLSHRKETRPNPQMKDRPAVSLASYLYP